MKEILKKAMIPIFLSIISGFACGKIVYDIYLGDSDLTYDNNLVYLIQSGAYSSYDSMRANTTSYDYIYYEEDDLFKTVIGLTKKEENIEKIKSNYNGDIIITKYYITDNELNSKIIEYDNILSNEKNKDKIKEVIIKMLNLYKGENDIKLIKVS